MKDFSLMVEEKFAQSEDLKKYDFYGNPYGITRPGSDLDK